jgi:hypothetical protein
MIRASILALFAAALAAQTLPRPDQIRNWQQVRPLTGTRAGTQVAVEQLRISPDFIASWRKAGGYDHYRIAVVRTQDNPILITCPFSEHSSFGAGCETKWPRWFRWNERKGVTP